jgi:hypothetical protein
VNQVFLVILGHGVKNKIDPQMKGVFALRLAARSAGIGPLSNLVSFPGAAEIVLAVDDRCGGADRNSLEVGTDDPNAANAAQKIIASERGVAGRQALEFISGKDPLQLASHGFVKAVALLAEGVVDQ